MKFNSKYLLAIVPLLLVFGVIYYFNDIVSYVVLAWVLSMLGAPVMKFLRKFMGSTIAAALTLLGFLVGFGFLVSIFIPPLLQQARNLASIDYNNIVQGLEEPINDWENFLKEKGIIEDLEVNATIDSTDILIEKQNKFDTQVIRLDSLLMENGDTLLAHQLPVTIVLNLDNYIQNNDKSAPKKEDKQVHFFDKARDNIATYINPSQIQKILGSLIGFFGNILIALMAVFFIAFFFLKEQGLFGKMLSALVPNEYETQTSKTLDETASLLIRYFVGVATQITLITLFVAVSMGFLGIKNALLIGFFAALMNVIPYIGPLLGASFAIIITISSNLDLSFYNEMIPLLFKVLGVFAVMQMMDNFLIQPNIFGKSVKAHPLEIFIVVLIGAKLGGILGMVIAIPMYTVLRVIAKVFFSEFKIVQQITKSLH